MMKNIFKFLREAYYRLKLNPPFGFHLSSFNLAVERGLSDGLDSGIATINIADPFIGCIIFNNKITYSFWDATRYYNWLNEGAFVGAKGETLYRYYDSRPSFYTMNRLKKMLDPFRTQKVQQQERERREAAKNFLKQLDGGDKKVVPLRAVK